MADTWPKPRLGISTCLLGEKVRYDGAGKRDRFLTDTFGQFVEWVPVCPEVECGLPVPREAMHLEGDPDAPRLITRNTRIDHTERMSAWARGRLAELEREDLSGYIFKSDSPSSGMERVRVYDDKGVPRKIGVGLWARAFMERFHLLPVEDEGRLHDPVLRENFIERVFCLKRYRDAMRPRRSRGALVSFHAAHKLQLMAHSPATLREMGRLVARSKELGIDELYAAYEELLMKAMKLKASPGKNANVLQHAMGYFKNTLSPDEKQEALDIVAEYRAEHIPLIVPATLMAHYTRKYGVDYLASQTYFNPHPIELKLRNHA
ncbi:MAG: DUF523 and DUF1722 domain-containing protein [Candidatus Eisenbacteria bacterium]|nr:DUF523 and DUF1722 domain-containing protein [Candidatus Eisenbacteria bacterium]